MSDMTIAMNPTAFGSAGTTGEGSVHWFAMTGMTGMTNPPTGVRGT